MEIRLITCIILTAWALSLLGSAGHAEGFASVPGEHGGRPGVFAIEPTPSGDWCASFSLDHPALVRVESRFRVKAIASPMPNDAVDVLLTIDGRPLGRNPFGSLLRLRPQERDAQARLDTGWQDAAIEAGLLAGTHVLQMRLRAADDKGTRDWCVLEVERVAIHPMGSVSFTGDGGFTIHAGGYDIPSSSWVSRPGGGWYCLGLDAFPPGETVTWHLLTIRQEASTWEGTAENEQFRLHRTIGVKDHRIEVQDTFTNLTSSDLGWMVKHELAIPALQPPATAHLGGDSRTYPSPIYTTVIKDGDREVGIDCWRAANPTVYVPLAEAGVGLVIEDDVTRVHSYTYSRRQPSGELVVGFRDEEFALPPGGEYTKRWAAYTIVTPKHDYYDFINRVRADWGVNKIRVAGPTLWSSVVPRLRDTSDDDFAARLHQSGAWAVASSLNGWIAALPDGKTLEPGALRPIGFGPGVLNPYFAAQRRTWAQDADRVHRLAPAMKVLHYFHTFLYAPEPDAESFKDSWVTRSDGTRAITEWGSLNLAPAGQVFPTSTNAVGKGMLKVLDEMLGPMSGDGIYFDEVNYPTGIGWLGVPPRTFNAWDGYSAVLDPTTFAVVTKTGYLQMLTADYKKRLFELLASRGAAILGNGQPETGWENALTFPRHTECRTDPYPRAYESHLYSPIALAEDRSFAHKRHMLEYGVIDAFVGQDRQGIDQEDLIRTCYPITVREIHAGWLQGEERVITMVSGSYSWHESTSVRIHEFNSEGMRAGTREAFDDTGTFDLEVPHDGMVILERRVNTAAGMR